MQFVLIQMDPLSVFVMMDIREMALLVLISMNVRMMFAKLTLIV